MDLKNAQTLETLLLYGDKGSCKTSFLLGYACEYLAQFCEDSSFAYFISFFIIIIVSSNNNF